MVDVSDEILTENRVLKAKLEEMNSRLNSLDTLGSQGQVEQLEELQKMRKLFEGKVRQL